MKKVDLYLLISYFPIGLILLVQSIMNKYEGYLAVIWLGFTLVTIPSIYFFRRYYTLSLPHKNIVILLLFIAHVIVLYVGIFLYPILIDYSGISLIELYRNIFFIQLILIAFAMIVGNLFKTQFELTLYSSILPTNVKDKIITLIKDDKINIALEELYQFYHSENSFKLMNIILSLQNKAKKLNELEMKNLIPYSDLNIEKSRLIDAILKIINESH